VNKKKQKNFDDFGLWAQTPPSPLAQIDNSFLLLFFKKEVLSLLLLKFTSPLASLYSI
jgi:hypothetical protein